MPVGAASPTLFPFMTDFQKDPVNAAADLPDPVVHTHGDSAGIPIEAGSAVLLLVGSVDRAWAAQTAFDLCTEWAADGRRVVLADMHLENPVLHDLLHVENSEGVVDIFLYGASIARSARPVEGRGFYLITAGTYEVDVESIYRHPRWAKLTTGFRDANASLVLFAPVGTVDLEAIAAWLGQIVLLGAPPSGVLPGDLEGGPPTISRMLVPPGYELPEREMTGGGVSAAGEEQDVELSLPPSPRRTTERTRRGVTVAITILVLIALLAAAGFALARYRPDLVPWLAPGGGAGDAGASTTRSTTGPAARRAGETVPFAVLVKSYASLSAAQQQVEVEQRRFSDTPFYISPEDDSGILYYKVYAGLLRDTASAERLRERLLQAGSVDADDTLGALSLIHRAHLSFDLGEFATRDSAVAARDSLSTREIPTYAVPMPYEDGIRRWQLYGGAYRDSATADAMRRRLTGAGIDPRLVLRVGEPAPGTE
jgi:hypothetical protein